MIVSLPHAVSTGAIATALYWVAEYNRRINRLFETSKPVLTEASRNAAYLWGEYDFSLLKKILKLVTVVGPLQTLYALAHNEGCDRCHSWKGGERRRHRGAPGDRLPGNGSRGKDRFTDDPEIVIKILRRHRN
jgi:hypothetical protein